MSLSIDVIDHIVLSVADLEVRAAWYVRVLGMERIEFQSHTGARVSLRFGNPKIDLRPANTDTVTPLSYRWFRCFYRNCLPFSPRQKARQIREPVRR
jgi:hypothetical protein